jgi:carboxyl-terminal processing protease
MRALALFLLLGACGEDPPTPEAQLAAGAVLAALDTLAASPTHPLSPLAAHLLVLEAERAAVREAEGGMLRDAALQALEAGDLAKGAAVLATARRALPDDPDLAALDARLRSALPGASPAARARVLAAQAEGTFDPVRARALQREGALATAAARLEPAVLSSVRANQGGATVPAAQALLQQLDAEYFRPIAWADSADLARGALAAVRASEAGRAQWPAISDVVQPQAPVVDLATAQADLAAQVAAHAQAGVPAEVVVDTWVRGAMAALDPWSRPVWPAEIATWEAGHAGVYHGLGLELESRADGAVEIAGLLPGTSAWASGLHQGDLLLEVRDDSGTLRLSDLAPLDALVAARQALVGPTGSAVHLLTARFDETGLTRLTRGPVAPETVQGWERGPDNAWLPWLDADAGIAYVRIRRFKPPTQPDFDAMLEPHLDDIRGLVLDLRGNPGGDVNAAVQIADRFIADGRLAELSGRVLPETSHDVDPQTGEALPSWNDGIPGHALEGVPTIVLVDADSASATEVLAGALQERVGARVVGDATWGKGRAQALRTNADAGYAVQFTNVVWALPSGRKLARGEPGAGGISPDVQVALSPAERFQIDRGARARAALRVHADGTPMTWKDPGRRDDLPPLSDDPVARTAELLLKATLTTTPPG